MNALDVLYNRRSIPPAKLGEPGPSADERAALFQAAVTVPDHGQLRPWRFIAIHGAARSALGELFARAARDRDPALSEAKIEKQRVKPLQAPLVVVVVARPVADNPKIPEVEQWISAGLAAEHIQLAAQALGYGSVWYTGDTARDRQVAEALGLAVDEGIAGLLYIGTPQDTVPERPRPDPAAVVTEWTGPMAAEETAS